MDCSSLNLISRFCYWWVLLEFSTLPVLSLRTDDLLEFREFVSVASTCLAFIRNSWPKTDKPQWNYNKALKLQANVTIEKCNYFQLYISLVLWDIWIPCCVGSGSHFKAFQILMRFSLDADKLSLYLRRDRQKKRFTKLQQNTPPPTGIQIFTQFKQRSTSAKKFKITNSWLQKHTKLFNWRDT